MVNIRILIWNEPRPLAFDICLNQISRVDCIDVHIMAVQLSRQIGHVQNIAELWAIVLLSALGNALFTIQERL